MYLNIIIKITKYNLLGAFASERVLLEENKMSHFVLKKQKKLTRKFCLDFLRRKFN